MRHSYENPFKKRHEMKLKQNFAVEQCFSIHLTEHHLAHGCIGKLIDGSFDASVSLIADVSAGTPQMVLHRLGCQSANAEEAYRIMMNDIKAKSERANKRICIVEGKSSTKLLNVDEQITILKGLFSSIVVIDHDFGKIRID